MSTLRRLKHSSELLDNMLHQFCRVSSRTALVKPPNILIRTDDTSRFYKWKELLNSILENNMYTIYSIEGSKFHSHPWEETCALLIYEVTEKLENRDRLKLDHFLQRFSGKVLVQHSSMRENLDSEIEFSISDQKSLRNIENLSDQVWFHEEGDKYFLNDNICIISKDFISEGICNDANSSRKETLSTILSRLQMSLKGKASTLPNAPNHGFIFLSGQLGIDNIFNMCSEKDFSFIRGSKLMMRFYSSEKSCKHLRDTSDTFDELKDDNLSLSVISAGIDAQCSFACKQYFERLHTESLGRSVLYFDAVESTQEVLKRINVTSIKRDGIAVVARQQTKGKGRSGNEWLSPIGCMMVSCLVSIPLSSNLGRRLPFIQHIVAVAFVRALKSRKGYENLQINLKWPNDIYIKKSVKVGGVIVNSTFFDGDFKVIFGIGVNVCNDRPTESVNSLIRKYNVENKTNLQELTIEEMLAGMMNQVELLINLCQREGCDAFCREYYKHWLHDKQVVILESQNNERAEIVGLDENGYLQVRLLTDCNLVSLQPDGNSFDMMRNLIVVKR